MQTEQEVVRDPRLLLRKCLLVFLQLYQAYLIFSKFHDVVYNLGVSEHFWPKNHTKKFTKFIKILNYIWIIPLCILLTWRIDTVWSKDFDKSWSGGFRIFWVQKFIKEKWTNSQWDFWIIPSLRTWFFRPKTSWYAQIIYWRHALKAFLPLPTRFYNLTILSVKSGSIIFYDFLACTNPTILLEAMLQVLILFWYLFCKCFKYIKSI